MRTKIEALVDRILLLYAVEQGNKHGCMDGPFKLMKIPFMAQLESVENGVNTFNYTFYRFNHGPMTTEIYEDAKQLRLSGLLDVPATRRVNIKLTESGERLLEEISELLGENKQVCKYVKNSAKEYAGLGFGDLKRVVYDRKVEVCGQRMKIAAAPFYCDVITKLNSEKATRFQIDDDWIDTLWGYFNYSPEELAGIRVIRPMHRLHAVAV